MPHNRVSLGSKKKTHTHTQTLVGCWLLAACNHGGSDNTADIDGFSVVDVAAGVALICLLATNIADGVVIGTVAAAASAAATHLFVSPCQTICQSATQSQSQSLPICCCLPMYRVASKHIIHNFMQICRQPTVFNTFERIPNKSTDTNNTN